MDGGRFRPGAAQLILSGSALAVFLCIHVKQFRFGELAVPGDIHTLARATLSDRKMAGGYCVAVVALGVHLWKGWGSVVIALRLGPEHTANARFIGRLVVRTLPCMLALAAQLLSLVRRAVRVRVHRVCRRGGSLSPGERGRGQRCRRGLR